jgi:hypothetical protein
MISSSIRRRGDLSARATTVAGDGAGSKQAITTALCSGIFSSGGRW